MPKKTARERVATLLDRTCAPAQGGARASTAMTRGRASSRLEAFIRHRKVLRSYIRRRLSDPQDVADVMQEVAMIVIRAQESPEEPRQFIAWCNALARHVIARWYRKRIRRAELLNAYDLAIASVPPFGSSPEDVVEARQELAAALDGLSEDARALIVARYLLEESGGEIGERIEQSPASVRMRLMRLRAQLRKREASESRLGERHTPIGRPKSRPP